MSSVNSDGRRAQLSWARFDKIDNPARKILYGKGFGHDMHSVLKMPMIEDDIFCISCDKQNHKVRSFLPSCLGQLSAIGLLV